MKIKANVSFFHDGEPIEQAQVLDLPKDEALAIVATGVAFVIPGEDLKEKTRLPNQNGK